MTGHTGGKWVAREQENSFTIGQERDGGKLIAETAPFFSYLGEAAKERVRADALRIAACVNALDGLTTEQIEDGIFQKMREDRDFLAAEVDAMTKQRDELLSALTHSRGMLSNAAMRIKWLDISKAQQILSCVDIIDKSIAKAKGGAA